MMAINITAILSTLLFIQTALALPFGGWFHNHKANGTSPGFPTAFPTGGHHHGGSPTGVFPTGGFPTGSGSGPAPTGFSSGFQKREHHHHFFASGVAPSAGFPAPTGDFPAPTGGFPAPTGGFPAPTGGFAGPDGGYSSPDGSDNFVKRSEGGRFHGAVKEKNGFHWGFVKFPTAGVSTGGYATGTASSGLSTATGY